MATIRVLAGNGHPSLDDALHVLTLVVEVTHARPVIAGVFVFAEAIAVGCGPFLGLAAIVVGADVGGEHLVVLTVIGFLGEVNPIGDIAAVVDDDIGDGAESEGLEGLDHRTQLGFVAEGAVVVVEPPEVVVAHGLCAAVAALGNPDEVEGAGEVIGLLLEERPTGVFIRVPVESLEHHTSIVLRLCPKCGKFPCECPPPPPPKPCPVCGNLPCTCPGGNKKKVKVRLSHIRELLLHTDWHERIQFGDEMITLGDYVDKLKLRLPSIFEDDEELRERWSQPETRQQLLELLEESGFQEDKLNMLREFMGYEDCDMLDVLEFIAYNSTPIERERRAQILRQVEAGKLNRQQMDFVNYVLDLYVRNGFKELDSDKLSTILEMKYHSLTDAMNQLGLKPNEMRAFFLDIQEELYNGLAVVNYKKRNNAEDEYMPQYLMAAEPLLPPDPD